MERTYELKNILIETLAQRIKRNQHYSIRAFAKDLSINDSTLSQLISGKRKVTPNRIKTLGKSLGLNDKKIIQLIENAGVKFDREEVMVSLQKFNLTSEWYFDAIIELVKVKSDMTFKDIAQYLGITQSQAKIALKELIALEIITKQDNQLICNQSKSLTSFYESSSTSEALKEYQKKMLKLSEKALRNDPREKRNHTSHVMAVSSEKIPEVIKRIREFQHELANFIEDNHTKKDEVIAMQFSLFQLSNIGDQE